MRLIATALLTAVALTGCGLSSKPPPPPTEVQARAHLAKVVDVVLNGDVSKICELASATCGIDLRNIDVARIPKQPPVVVGTFVMEPAQRPDGAWNGGGFGLQLCGIDGTGKPYASEMLVFEAEAGTLRSINTLYWLGAGIARGNVIAPGVNGQPAC